MANGSTVSGPGFDPEPEHQSHPILENWSTPIAGRASQAGLREIPVIQDFIDRRRGRTQTKTKAKPPVRPTVSAFSCKHAGQAVVPDATGRPELYEVFEVEIDRLYRRPVTLREILWTCCGRTGDEVKERKSFEATIRANMARVGRIPSNDPGDTMVGRGVSLRLHCYRGTRGQNTVYIPEPCECTVRLIYTYLREMRDFDEFSRDAKKAKDRLHYDSERVAAGDRLASVLEILQLLSLKAAQGSESASRGKVADPTAIDIAIREAIQDARELKVDLECEKKGRFWKEFEPSGEYVFELVHQFARSVEAAKGRIEWVKKDKWKALEVALAKAARSSFRAWNNGQTQADIGGEETSFQSRKGHRRNANLLEEARQLVEQANVLEMRSPGNSLSKAIREHLEENFKFSGLIDKAPEIAQSGSGDEWDPRLMDDFQTNSRGQKGLVNNRVRELSREIEDPEIVKDPLGWGRKRLEEARPSRVFSESDVDTYGTGFIWAYTSLWSVGMGVFGAAEGMQALATDPRGVADAMAAQMSTRFNQIKGAYPGIHDLNAGLLAGAMFTSDMIGMTALLEAVRMEDSITGKRLNVIEAMERGSEGLRDLAATIAFSEAGLGKLRKLKGKKIDCPDPKTGPGKTQTKQGLKLPEGPEVKPKPGKTQAVPDSNSPLQILEGFRKAIGDLDDTTPTVKKPGPIDPDTTPVDPTKLNALGKKAHSNSVTGNGPGSQPPVRNGLPKPTRNGDASGTTAPVRHGDVTSRPGQTVAAELPDEIVKGRGVQDLIEDGRLEIEAGKQAAKVGQTQADIYGSAGTSPKSKRSGRGEGRSTESGGGRSGNGKDVRDYYGGKGRGQGRGRPESNIPRAKSGEPLADWPNKPGDYKVRIDRAAAKLPRGVTRRQLKQYADAVWENLQFEWETNVTGGSRLTQSQRKAIREACIEEGVIPHVPKKTTSRPGTRGYADFEAAGVVRTVQTLPPKLYKAKDTPQFNYLDDLIGGRPEGYMWHHSEIKGRMELVPIGLHRVYGHEGGRSPGHWAEGPR